MNIIQQKLLAIAQAEDIEKLRRVDLVEMVGCEYPSQITHHLAQLTKKGQLMRQSGRLMPALATSLGLIHIPVMGEADCGEATKYADGQIVDTLVISPSLISIKSTKDVYALIARGDSMNRAEVNGKYIEDGDYVIVQRSNGYVPKNNEIVVSIIAGLANIKRFIHDQVNRRILLLPDSYRQSEYAPIIISEEDDFQVEARVVDVVKGIQKPSLI